MSRSNPTDGIKNPATRWFEWAGGDEGGIKHYDKEAKADVKVALPFTFLLLDELSTVKGWHEPSESGIYANEVRDTRQDALVVRAFKGASWRAAFIPRSATGSWPWAGTTSRPSTSPSRKGTRSRSEPVS